MRFESGLESRQSLRVANRIGEIIPDCRAHIGECSLSTGFFVAFWNAENTRIDRRAESPRWCVKF